MRCTDCEGPRSAVFFLSILVLCPFSLIQIPRRQPADSSVSYLNSRDQLLHPFSLVGKIVVLYILFMWIDTAENSPQNWYDSLIFFFAALVVRWDSVVSIVSSSGIKSRLERETCLLSRSSRPHLRPTQPIHGYRGFIFPIRIKRWGSEFDCLHASSVEVKNGWSYTSTLPIRLYDLERSSFT